MSYDLTGNRYGRLTVIKEVPERYRGQKQYLCRCDCGNTTIAPSYLLRHGDIKSCKCLQKEISAKTLAENSKCRPGVKDITHQKFGRLVAVEFVGKDKHRCALWKCRCDCGNETIVTGASLRSGHTTSCGCVQKSNWKKAVEFKAGCVIGRRYGKLVVSKEIDDKYLCHCDCGRNILCHKSSIYKMTSCGCENGFRKNRRKVFQDLTGELPPDGYHIVSLDGDKNNTEIDNLMPVSNAVYLQMLRGNLFSEDKELTRTAILACELSHEVKVSTSKKRECYTNKPTAGRSP